MASRQQHRAYDPAGRSHANAGVPGVLEHVPGRGAAGRHPGGSADVLGTDFSLPFSGKGKDRLEYYGALGQDCGRLCPGRDCGRAV